MSGPVRQIRWFAAARELSPDEFPRAEAAPSFVWRQPSAELSATVWGEASVVEGDVATDPSGLRGIAAYAVEWVTPRAPAPGPWWGGFAFDAAAPRDPDWRDFGCARWILPELALLEVKGRRWLVATGASAAEPMGVLEAAVRRGDPADAQTPRAIMNRVEGREAWTALVHAADAAFASGALSKVVAARRIQVTLDRAADPRAISDALAAMHPGCATFAIVVGDRLFAGATPETLLRIEAGRAFVDALAGTVPPGVAPTDKELREHRFVVDAVCEGLRPFARSLEVEPAPSLLPLRNLVHLRTKVVAALEERSALGAIAGALHPTPAVCGTPREAARTWIREHEGFDRGWYAGAVGWVDDRDAHLCVALRCALFHQDRAQVFVGAGLVPGSTPEAEWDETSRKASAVLDALGGRP